MNVPVRAMQISVAPYSPDRFAELAAVRSAVFTDEQGIAAAINFDGLDPEAVHASARVDGRYVGVARMLADGHIGRVAVLEDHRHGGIGAALTQALTDYARTRGYSRVYLAAQESAIPFYLKLGFTAFGDRYLEAGILHQDMRLDLA